MKVTDKTSSISSESSVPPLSDRASVAIIYEHLSTFIGTGVGIYAIAVLATFTGTSIEPPMIMIFALGVLMPPLGATALYRRSKELLGLSASEQKRMWLKLVLVSLVGLGAFGAWQLRQVYGRRLRELGMVPKWYGLGSENMNSLRIEREEQLAVVNH